MFLYFLGFSLYLLLARGILQYVILWKNIAVVWYFPALISYQMDMEDGLDTFYTFG